VHPEGARNQIDGGAIQALSWTVKEGLKIENDRIPTLDWLSHPILKFYSSDDDAMCPVVKESMDDTEWQHWASSSMEIRSRSGAGRFG
jgi:hypothetical protein